MFMRGTAAVSMAYAPAHRRCAGMAQPQHTRVHRIARKPPGFAFIEFDDSRDADDAVRKLDG